MPNQQAFRAISFFRFMRKTCFIRKLVLLVALVIAAAGTNAQSGRSDYDMDQDGLIEILSVEDFLAIPDAARGAVRLYGSSEGCPEPACLGYELMSDLDFADLPNVQLPMPSLYYVIFEGNYQCDKKD